MKSIFQNQKTNQKDSHQGKLSFSCLKFYQHNCLNKLADKSISQKQINNQ